MRVNPLFLSLCSVAASIVIVGYAYNIYLEFIHPAENSTFFSWTLTNDEYGARYIFWQKSACHDGRSQCATKEDSLLPYPALLIHGAHNKSCTSMQRIMFLGDSFTGAPWVDETSSYAAVFASQYANVHDTCVWMYRLSSNGVGNDQEVARFTDTVEQLRPDIVIWQFYYNDMYENIKYSRFDIHNGVLQRKFSWYNAVLLTGWINQHVPFVAQSAIGKHVLYQANVVDVLREWPADIYGGDASVQYLKKKVPLLLGEMDALANTYHFELYTTLAPLECQIIESIPCTTASSIPQDAIRATLLLHPSYVSMEPTIQQKGVNLAMYDGDLYPFNTVEDKEDPGVRHLSKQGDFLVGTVLFSEFEKRKVPNRVTQ